MIYDKWIYYRQAANEMRPIRYKMIQLHNYRIKNTTSNCIWYVLCDIDDNFNRNVAQRMITFHEYHVLYIKLKSIGLVLPPVMTNSHHNQGWAAFGHWIIVHSLIVHNFFVHRFIVHNFIVHKIIVHNFFSAQTYCAQTYCAHRCCAHRNT